MDENSRPVESLSEATGDEVREQIFGAPEPGLSVEIETSTDDDAIAALRPREERKPEADQGPSDEQIFFEEGYSSEDERWLAENPDAVELVEPRSADDLRENARVVKAARAQDEIEQELGTYEADYALALAREAYEQGYDPYEIAAALAEGPHAQQAGPFLETWAEDEPDEAVEALSALVGWKVGRREDARRAAEVERQTEVNAAWNEAVAASALTEAGAELVRSLLEADPARVIAIQTPEEAREVIARTIFEAKEIRRAQNERDIREGIRTAQGSNDMDRGWGSVGDDDPWETPLNFRTVERPRETVGEMKKALMDNGRGNDLAAFVAEHNPQPLPPDGVRRSPPKGWGQ